MKPLNKFILTIPFLASVLTASATTHAVLPGASIQAKINLAVAGDIVAIFGGTYNEDLTINKAIRLVEVSGQQVTITGNVTFSGVANCPPFEGFTVGSSGRGITVTNTSGLVFRNLDARNGSGITTSGTTNLKIADSQLSNLTAGGTTTEVAKTSLTGGINQTAGSLFASSVTVAGNFETQTAALKTVAFRSNVTGDNNWRSKKNWYGYSILKGFNFIDQSEADAVLIGCTVDRRESEGNGISLRGHGNKFHILSNTVIGVRYSGTNINSNGLEGSGLNNSYNICNNYFNLVHIYQYGYSWWDNFWSGNGIQINDSSNAVVSNNIVVGAKNGINAIFGTKASNNMYWNSISNGKEGNGVMAEETICKDPLFVANEAPKLQSASPCINAGTPDPRYNDRDGTRNDIGPSGGPWLDPDGWTTENPVVISFDLSPDMVLEGVDTEVILSEGQAVSAP